MAGEQRFASIVAKRLESLGALTHGDRRASESRDLSRYNIDNKYGRLALVTVMKSVMQYEAPLVRPPAEYHNSNSFFADVATALVGVGLVINSPNYPGQTVLDKDAMNMTRFLNRMLGMPIKTQNALFQYFTDTLAEIIKRAKRNGRFDLGILDLAEGEMRDVTHVSSSSYGRKHATGTGVIKLNEIIVNRGMSWESAVNRLNDLTGKNEGFYLAIKNVDGRRQCVLAVSADADSSASRKKKEKKLYMIFRPHIGLQPNREYLSNLRTNYNKVDATEAKVAWEAQFESSNLSCSHLYWGRTCRNSLLGKQCQVGIRKRTLHILSGSVLLVWREVEHILANSQHNADVKMQVMRVRGTGFKVIGLLIPNETVEKLKEALRDEQYFEKRNELILLAKQFKTDRKRDVDEEEDDPLFTGGFNYF